MRCDWHNSEREWFGCRLVAWGREINGGVLHFFTLGHSLDSIAATIHQENCFAIASMDMWSQRHFSLDDCVTKTHSVCCDATWTEIHVRNKYTEPQSAWTDDHHACSCNIQNKTGQGYFARSYELPRKTKHMGRGNSVFWAISATCETSFPHVWPSCISVYSVDFTAIVVSSRASNEFHFSSHFVGCFRTHGTELDFRKMLVSLKDRLFLSESCMTKFVSALEN